MITLTTISGILAVVQAPAASIALLKLTKLVTFFAVFCLLVFFHEFGHFAAAKLNKILVHEFAIGMGPIVFRKQFGETVYSLRMFPVGGFVNMEGEDAGSNHPRSLSVAKPWQKLSILLAGPFMNFVLAVLLFSILFFNVGIPSTVVDEVIKDKPAYTAGLLAGDQIVKMNAAPITDWESVTKKIESASGAIKMDVLRGEGAAQKTVSLSVTPVKDEQSGRMIVGIKPRPAKNPIKVMSYSIDRVGFMTKSILVFLVQMPFKGVADGDVVGPVGMFNIVGDAAKSGWLDVLFITSVLSINLGIFNLLPFPALDGGRVVFAVVEWIRGKPIAPEKEGYVHYIGFAILISLMIFLVINDIRRL